MGEFQKWQPIETAPLDIPVLIWDGKMIATARKEIFADLMMWEAWGADGYECENTFGEPTHWMPLPGPPQ